MGKRKFKPDSRPRHAKQPRSSYTKPLKNEINFRYFVPTCLHCNEPATRAVFRDVAGAITEETRADLLDRHVWACQPCSAYVLCHQHEGQDTWCALGRPADRETRNARLVLHRRIDPFFAAAETSRVRYARRNTVYQLMGSVMGLRNPAEVHIGDMSVDDMRRVHKALDEVRFDNIGFMDVDEVMSAMRVKTLQLLLSGTRQSNRQV
ncbi:MAG: hypothetical protein DI640_12945 [Sphingomonas taxi]|uniref:Uncharacterized protein n=1 Tax=Sphingomonas taxi TaxID=1549858 RepID=A0A2W4YRW1_9SPHN|nr:MAG: hypothetical protein DI640_12945 [Sphingomonas taxi]